MIDIPPTISIIFFTIWLILFLTGRFQFKQIQQFTATLVEKNFQLATNRKPDLSVNEYFDEIYPEWEQNITKKFYFIPHKTELFPIFINPKNVAKRINFTPEWVGAYLQLKGNHLECTKAQEKIIDLILSKVQKK